MAARARKATSPSNFISLTELAHPRASLKDLSGLVPAAIISLVLNIALVIALLWSNSGRAGASEIQTVLAEANDRTFLLDNSKLIELDGESPTLDDMPLDPAEPTVPAMLPSLVEPDKKPGAPGPDSGFPGAGDQNDALPGPLVPVQPGFPLRDGPGLPGGPSGFEGPGRGWDKWGGDREANRKTALDRGASTESERAVARGLLWLVRHQSPDGRWSLDKYHQHAPGCDCKGPDEKAGANDTAATALSLLPFLGAGQTHKKGQFQRNIHAGLKFLLSKQNSQGDLGGGMYSHGIGAIALCEAYAMTRDQALRDAAQRALNFIVNAQHKTNGGWRYTARYDTSDTSVVAWQVMALRSGQMAGLNVPAQTLQGAKRWLDSCAKDGGSKYSYTPEEGFTPAMTAAGLLNRQYLGWGPRNPDLHKGCQYMMQNLPPAKANTETRLGAIYYYYYAAQVMHHMDGDYWNKWNPLCRDFLIATQQKEGHKAGSWNPEGADWGGPGGRIYSTSLSILTLEVYYRHLPLYRREAGAREADMEAKPKPEKKEMKPAERRRNSADSIPTEASCP